MKAMILIIVLIGMSLNVFSSTTDTEGIKLKFEGFILDAKESMGLPEVLEKFPESLSHLSWEMDLIDEDDKIYHLSLKSEHGLSESKLWDISYSLKDSSIDFIDPVFIPKNAELLQTKADSLVKMLGSESAKNCSIPLMLRSRYQYNGLPLCQPIESDDFMWVHKKMKTFEAWKYAGRKGEDILIGHPDTGYSKHPEIFENILVDLSYDFVGKDEDATARPNSSNHGTSTASVMVSPKGRQLTNFTDRQIEIFGTDPEAQPYVVGVSPESKLISYKVSNGSVIHFSFVRVTKAINQAVKDGAKVISLSLGGPLPMPWLHRAIKKAMKSGAIIIAASGNHIPDFILNKFVVWPAHYKETIAVAASNAKDEVWTGSSKGKQIDITAPGENVWRAKAKGRDIASMKYEIARSNGTSYSTALTAGAASLFLSHHGVAFLEDKYGKKNITSLFKYMLKNYGYSVPSDKWNADEYGPGILDIYKLVSAPLPTKAELFGIDGKEVNTIPIDAIIALFPKRSKYLVRRGLKQLFRATSNSDLDAKLEVIGDEFAHMFLKDPKYIKLFEMAITSDFYMRLQRIRRLRSHMKRSKPSQKLISELKL